MKKKGRSNENLRISFSFLIGFILSILPLPTWLAWCRPSWTLLILVYWLIALPFRIGIVTSWFIGLLVDLLTGSLLGMHALIFTLAAYFILKYHVAIRGFSAGQKILLICAFQSVDLSIQYLLSSHFHAQPETWRYWLPILTTTLFWPIVSGILRNYRKPLKVI